MFNSSVWAFSMGMWEYNCVCMYVYTLMCREVFLKGHIFWLISCHGHLILLAEPAKLKKTPKESVVFCTDPSLHHMTEKIFLWWNIY